MKRIQPYFYIVGLAGLFILAGLVLFTLQLFPAEENSGITVDPLTQEQSEALYDLWFASAGIYDLSVDHALSGILFSTDSNAVSLLDRDRRLVWDKVFASSPRQAELSSCGRYVVVGTSGGKLYFTTVDQQTWWENDGDPVDLVAISPGASWIAAARSRSDLDLYHLDLFSQSGDLVWSIDTGPVENLYISSEYLEQPNIYYTSLEEEGPVVNAVNLEGDLLWSYEGQSLAAVSRHGSRLAVIEGSSLFVYDSLGYALWSTQLPFEAKTVKFNPQNYNRILVYGSREGGGENLFYFDLAEDLLWIKNIADGSLFSFTADGQHIITSSWRHYKEDHTQMILHDSDGVELSSWEIAMRVEHLVVTGHPHLVTICGDDGYIDLVDLQPLLSENGNGTPEAPLYRPVTTRVNADETKIVLYFIDENSNLVPVTRTVALTESPMRIALEELIRGPARGSELYRTIPDKDYAVGLEFTSASGRLVLDLSPELVQVNGLTQSMSAYNSLLMTVSSFTEVGEILMTMSNEPIEIFGDGVTLDQPIAPHRWNKPIFVPVKSGNRYYLVVREGIETVNGNQLQDLVEQVLLAFRPLSFVPSELALIDLRVLPENILINMNTTFQTLFPEDPSEEDRLQSALLLDALFMTVFENSRSQRAEIIIDGEKWAPPIGYPSTNRFFRQPYYLNPE
jgi:hypothetical protein